MVGVCGLVMNMLGAEEWIPQQDAFSFSAKLHPLSSKMKPNPEEKSLSWDKNVCIQELPQKETRKKEHR